jgi:chromosome segregation ATPase
LHFLPASVPIVNDLQSRITELIEELGQQGPALTSAQQELTRLQAVEADLSRTVEALRAEITALQTAHSADLRSAATAAEALRTERDAAVAAREALQAEKDEALAARDAQITKYDELEKHSYEETTRLRRKAKGFNDTMVEMDNILTGKSLLLSSALAECTILLSCFSCFSS